MVVDLVEVLLPAGQFARIQICIPPKLVHFPTQVSTVEQLKNSFCDVRLGVATPVDLSL